MRPSIANIFKKSALITVAAVSVLSFWSAGIITLAQPEIASAASCPQDSAPETNIIFCGLDSSSAGNALNSFKSSMNSGDAHGHSAADIKATAAATGYSDAELSSGSWVLGTSYDKSTSPLSNHTSIVVNGQVVAQDLFITQRCFPTGGYCQPSSAYPALNDASGHAISNVHIRDGNWFFMKDSSGTLIHTMPVLVHMNAQGGADFALWTPCGNTLRIKPVNHPQKSLVCVSLTAAKGDENDASINYSFNATASRANTTITHYTFDFGDSHTQQVNVNDATTAKTSHSYDKTDVKQTLTAKVTVSDASTTVGSANCQVQVVVPPKQKSEQALVCTNLTAQALDTAKTQYTFTATATLKNTTADHFTFVYDNGKTEDVQASSTSATAATATSSTQTFASGDHTITATVTGPLGTFGSNNCSTKITASRTPLPSTGPEGMLGLFGLTTVAGGLFHQFVLRKKLTA